MKNIARKQVRDEQQRKGKDENYNKYSRTFQKAHLDPITNALKVESNVKQNFFFSKKKLKKRALTKKTSGKSSSSNRVVAVVVVVVVVV
ncbi:hypothetical protein ElyMa_001181200 [Elysia marginata]|uniref:NUC153 domain-containing protein n=1 Tax=Elysia marginata TaxID=1093978 RepID=A0AAV4I4Y2_9GAST|nr:hypothetical protein ElyMa_001181200 [Elysia marginata]